MRPGCANGNPHPSPRSSSIAVLEIAFVAAGAGIGCVETGEHAAVAGFAPSKLRGSAFGLLAAVQSVGNLAESAVAGIIWTAVSPRAAFPYIAALMLISTAALGGQLILRSR